MPLGAIKLRYEGGYILVQANLKFDLNSNLKFDLNSNLKFVVQENLIQIRTPVHSICSIWTGPSH